jgi:transcriptional regulator with XRE-family HTH domain
MARKRQRLAERRKALGFTQEALAERLGCERTTIVRWENAETEPQPCLRPKICQALRLTPEELGELIADVTDIPGQQGDGVHAASIPLDFSAQNADIVVIMDGFAAHDLASRRDVLADLAVLSGTALVQPVRQWAACLTPLPDRSPRVGADEVSELERTVMLFRRWEGSTGGLHRKAVVGQLKAVTEMLSDHHVPAIRTRLFSVTAELAGLAGGMAYDQGLYGTAQRYWLMALPVCLESDNAALGAKIIGDMSRISANHGRHDESLGLLHTALYSLPRQASDLVRSELHGLEAMQYARLGPGDRQNAGRSVATCIALYEEAPADPPPGWQRYMNLAEVDFLAASSYTELALRAEDHSGRRHYAAKAEAHSVRACQNRPGEFVLSRAFDEVRLARVRLAQHEPAEAAAVGAHAIKLAGPTRPPHVIKRLTDFGRELAGRYPDLPEAADFGEHLRDYLHGAAAA